MFIYMYIYIHILIVCIYLCLALSLSLSLSLLITYFYSLDCMFNRELPYILSSDTPFRTGSAPWKVSGPYESCL